MHPEESYYIVNWLAIIIDIIQNITSFHYAVYLLIDSVIRLGRKQSWTVLTYQHTSLIAEV
jgi:hypothetical protein